MKHIFIALLLCVVLVAVPAFAQEQNKFGAAGVFFNQEVTGSVGGWAALAIPIAERTLSFTDYDVNAVTGDGGGTVSFFGKQIQYTIRTGFANRIYGIGRFSLWALGDAGITALDDNVVGSFAGGGFLHYKITDRWGGLAILQADHNSITGTDFKPRFGISVKF
jgi:hypothetical protein